MNNCVLDASAILTLLNNEAGASMVQELLSGAIVSAVNYAEVVARLSLLGMPENEILEALDILGLEIIPFDKEQSFQAGTLVTITRPYGLSLGDRACLALAHQSGLPAVTSDRAWQDVKAGIEVRLIR